MRSNTRDADNTNLEAQLRDAFAAQSRALPPLHTTADDIRNGTLTTGTITTGTANRDDHTERDGVVVLADRKRATWHRQRAGLLAVAAALAVAAVASVAMIRNLDRTTATDPASQPDPIPQSEQASPTEGAAVDPSALANQWSTPTVRAWFESLTVETAGLTFTPPQGLSDELSVGSDPGDDTYTTLEATWFQHDREMRMNLYFTADDSDWWVNEIRVYDGEEQAEWVEWTGDYFRTPRGEAYVGDVDLDGILTIDTLVLEAFIPPAACAADATGLALIPRYDVVEMSAVASGFGFSAGLVDASNCEPVPINGYTLDAALADETVAAIAEPLSTDGADAYWSLERVGTGETTLELTVIDGDGNVVAAASVPVVVE